MAGADPIWKQPCTRAMYKNHARAHMHATCGVDLAQLICCTFNGAGMHECGLRRSGFSVWCTCAMRAWLICLAVLQLTSFLEPLSFT